MLQLSQASAFSSLLPPPPSFSSTLRSPLFLSLVSPISFLVRSRPKFETLQRQWQHTHSFSSFFSAVFFSLYSAFFLPLQRVIGA